MDVMPEGAVEPRQGIEGVADDEPSCAWRLVITTLVSAAKDAFVMWMACMRHIGSLAFRPVVIQFVTAGVIYLFDGAFSVFDVCVMIYNHESWIDPTDRCRMDTFLLSVGMLVLEIVAFIVGLRHASVSGPSNGLPTYLYALWVIIVMMWTWISLARFSVPGMDCTSNDFASIPLVLILKTVSVFLSLLMVVLTACTK